ncbi:VWA domain containing CoxE-like protein [Nocardioides dokdonensis FR1436]|uniref:VWA domain containing CoxE-like protein n=1 Tax=Nocardioides dokdonensis FR1436 TaxID=1300347 RepID=A0A1A9GIN1_9ACTN|nr:VWA domain-containing protein [Nocardioides dokdonensis]ANH37936.1 VWA domain containing CoxE-like protein [Nocardioides dokdonensis FR1436]
MSTPARSGLLDRHIAFLEALRAAGLPVSLAEDLDAVAVLTALPWDDRDVVREGYAAAVVKKHAQRPTFDALFDLYFPRLVGDGATHLAGAPDDADDGATRDGDAEARDAPPGTVRDNAAALADVRERIAEALAAGDEQALARLAAEVVGRFGAMPGRGPGLSSWSAYTALQRVAPGELVDRIVAGLLAEGRGQEEAERGAAQRIGGFTRSVEADARRRIGEEKGADHVAQVALRPSIDRLDFLQMRRTDLEQMRREIYPLARRLATRLTQEHHAQRRGPLDFRRTVRASVSTGGVPLTTHHKPKRPHRSELVVLCDVSGSVANFAQFTLLLVFALREQFTKVRAFTFIDHVHEVTHHFQPGADVVDVMADLAASASHAALWGRTNYGRAIEKFAERHADAIGPRTSLLVLGDARSNYSDLGLETLRDLADQCRHAWWLNPEHRRHWDTGDSAATRYGEVVPMVECRNLNQLSELVHDLL